MPMSAIASASPAGVLAHGISAPVLIAITTIRTGARLWTNALPWTGTMFSLNISLNTSANDCRMPPGPTRFGPLRSWMNADTLRSA